MASTKARLDAQITVPTGGWTMTCTDDSGGPTAATIPAGTYWHGSDNDSAQTFAEALETAIDAVMGQNWGVSYTGDEGSSQEFYVIGCTGATCTVTWTDTELRDLMGFTGDLTGATEYTATKFPEGFWRSSYGWQSRCGADTFDGFPESDKQDAENSAGYLYSVTGQTKYVNAIYFPMESLANTVRVSEVTGNQSFQRFVEQGIHGSSNWGSSGGPIRFYPDEADNTTYVEYYVPGMQNWSPERLREDKLWDQYWRVGFDRLVKVPA